MGNFIARAIAKAQARGLKQAAIARAVGVDPSRLSEWKQGEGGPSLKVAVQIAQFVGASLDELAFDDHERPASLSIAELRAIEMIRILDLSLPDVVRGLTAAANWRDGGALPQQPSAHAEPGVPPENRGRKERGTG
jgi:transcriptional regulator with XRE-family HTH domain